MIPNYFLCFMQSSHFAVKLDMDFGLKAEKIGACVKVKWNRVQAGACYVRYEVILRNALSGIISSETGYNTGEMMLCKLSSSSNITYVELTVSFKTASINVTANVTVAPISTPVPTTPGMTLFCSFLLALLMPFVSLYKSRDALDVIPRMVFQLC